MTTQNKIVLSPKEETIVKMVAQAKGRKTIAAEMNLSIHTVDTHLRHIHLKTGTHSLPELIIWEISQMR